MSFIIIKPKDHNEWLQCRKSGIGSSDVGTILGVNPYETPYQLWAERKGLIPRKQENFLMKAGHYIENAVSQFFEDETGSCVIKSSAGDWLVVDKEHDWRRVSPDRYFWKKGDKHNQKNKCILECKTTQHDIDEEAPPRYWFTQLQYQLCVNNLQCGALAWLVQGRSFGYHYYDFNPDFCQYMMEEVDKFWFDCIIGNKEPEITSVGDIKIKYPTSFAGKTIDAVGSVLINNTEIDIIKACNDLKSIKADLAVLERKKDAYEDAIKFYMQDAEAIISEDKPIVTWKSNKPSTKLNTSRLKEELPEIVERYSEQVNGARVLRIK